MSKPPNSPNGTPPAASADETLEVLSPALPTLEPLPVTKDTTQSTILEKKRRREGTPRKRGHSAPLNRSRSSSVPRKDSEQQQKESTARNSSALDSDMGQQGPDNESKSLADHRRPTECFPVSSVTQEQPQGRKTCMLLNVILLAKCFFFRPPKICICCLETNKNESTNM